jgi:hypothetical protein
VDVLVLDSITAAVVIIEAPRPCMILRPTSTEQVNKLEAVEVEVASPTADVELRPVVETTDWIELPLEKLELDNVEFAQLEANRVEVVFGAEVGLVVDKLENCRGTRAVPLVMSIHPTILRAIPIFVVDAMDIAKGKEEYEPFCHRACRYTLQDQRTPACVVQVVLHC